MSIVVALSKSPNRTWCLQNISTTLHRLKRIRHQPISCQTASLPVDLHYSSQAQLLLSTITSWDFNIFSLDTLTYGRPLFYVSLHLFRQHNFIELFRLDFVKLMNLFCMIEDGYHQSNPYHNAVHAADVTQAMNCFLRESKFSQSLTPLEKLSGLLAAISHDIDHPGINQAFLVATDNPLVGLYESTSVLENHHWRSLMCILHLSHVFDHFDAESWTVLKWQTRTQILATDITRQEDILRKFQQHLNAGTLDMCRREADRNFALQIALKCADICNPCRPWKLSHRWGQLVCREFFLQGDDERRLKLPVTKTCDRYTSTVVKVQSGFISYVVRPLFVEWQRLVCSPLSNQLLENLTINLKRWNAVGADEAATVAAAGDSSNDSTPTPSTGEPNQYFTTPDNDDASKTTLGSTQPTDDGGTDGGVNCDSDNNSRRRSKAHAWLSDCQRDSSCQTVRCSSKDGDTFRRGSLPPPVVSVTDTKTHRRNSMPAVDGSQSSSMRRCILLTSLAENPPSVHVLSPDTPSPQPSVSPAHSGELNDIAQLNVDDCDKTCLLLTQCNGRRGSAPAACVVPNNIVPTTASCWKPASLWRDNRSKSHSATRSASLLLIETSSSSAARRSSNVVFPLDRRLVYMVAEGMGTPAVATVTSSQIVKGWSRSRRSNSAHAIIFRPRFVAGRRCSSPAIGNKNRTPWPTDDATDHMATDSGTSRSGRKNTFALDADLPIVCST